MSMQQEAGPVDFAISYAGEDLARVRPLADGLRELAFDVFLADDERLFMVGLIGEEFLDRLFSEAKVVIVFISRHYREKQWPRFEWDVIRKRSPQDRFIPIRLDDTPMLGLPSNFFFLEWSGTNLSEMVEACVSRLLQYEQSKGIKRPSLYDTILHEIRFGSRGATAKALQLVRDNRKRTPLDDAEMPKKGDWEPSYT
ncbi:MAG: toll/interleukin-1 receptor domain-containing protein, partial [Acidobacteriota bacterium]